jgi:serine/threonine protein kinase
MMAPEILNGEQYDSRVDIWSLGVTLLMLVEPDNPLFKLTPINGKKKIIIFFFI